MPSKKNKAKGKARRAAKSRKERADDGAVNGIDSEMQRLHIDRNKNSKDDDEDALLEAAMNLAAAEREELETAAKNDEEDNSLICNHGYVLFPENHVCLAFFKSFCDQLVACSGNKSTLYELFRQIYEATKRKFAEVWNDPDMMQWVASRCINYGVDMILEGNCQAVAVGQSAMCSSFFEQWAEEVIYQNETQASFNWDIFDALCDWTMMSELGVGDEHTLVSFFRKRIPCKCLDEKYKEVKSTPKIGFCHNPKCSLPGNKTVRSAMLYCTQCNVNYCSRECQVAHWPGHKQICAVAANMRAARKSRQKSR